jgi:uncharacterized protein YegL
MEVKSVTYSCFIQDHSGSMSNNQVLAVNNFNEQRAKLLKEDDETMDNFVTIIEFDDEIHCNIDGEPIADIPKIKDWWCGGMTALYEAIEYGIDRMKRKIDNDPRKDKAVLIVVQTDGMQNPPNEELRMKVKKMINELEDTKIWSFVFLGENIDEKTAMNMGFKAGNIMSHGSGDEVVAQAYACSTQGLGNFIKARKRGQTQTMSYYTGSGDSDN